MVDEKYEKVQRNIVGGLMSRRFYHLDDEVSDLVGALTWGVIKGIMES